MSVVPDKLSERIDFFEARISPWNTNATAIGTTVAKVTTLTGLTENAREKYAAQQAAKAAAKAATTALRAAIDAMSTEGASIIKQIRAQADIAGNNVYSLAQIPPPAIPGPTPPPGTPYEPKVTLNGNGHLMVAWKCNNPKSATGTIYQVYRRVNGAGEFAYIGGTGEKKYTDTTIPQGATSVTYQIQAVRSTAVGMWATFNVFFGSTDSSFAVTASVVEDAPKIAA